MADSTRPLLVWERPHHPVYYFPRQDVRTELIGVAERTEHRTGLGEAHLHTLTLGEREAPEGVITYPDSPKRIRDHIRFRWKAVDSWFEEDEEIYVHPRDPYTRIDILASSKVPSCLMLDRFERFGDQVDAAGVIPIAAEPITGTQGGVDIDRASHRPGHGRHPAGGGQRLAGT